MRKIKIKDMCIFIVIIATMFVASCADSITFKEAIIKQPVGFWHGLWHGIIIVPAWIGSLIWDDVSIYAIYNNGGWYDFGFMLGIGCFGGGTSRASKRR